MSKITMPEAAKVDVFHGTRYYTAAQMEAYAAAKVREALLAAAKVAMDAPITADMLDSDSAKAVAFHASARILALIPPQ